MTRKLHIGGLGRVEGWEVLDALPGEYVDHLGDARDLSRFADNTFAAVYASHVLEHFDYKDVLREVLGEWYRVLQPGGEIYISVPDMEKLCRLFLDKDKLELLDRFMVMRMMFGGHIDEYDYHLVGFDQDILVDFMVGAGFVNFRRVATFGFFDDTSHYEFKGTPISLNVIASKPG